MGREERAFQFLNLTPVAAMEAPRVPATETLSRYRQSGKDEGDHESEGVLLTN